jgi:hypothetical protein
VSSVERRLLLRVVLAASVIAVWLVSAPTTAHAATYGAVMSPITTCQDMPGNGNRSYSWHTAWFAGNPWSDVTPWLYN